MAEVTPDPKQQAPPPPLLRWVDGLDDDAARALTPAEAARLRDPFAASVLAVGGRPASLRDVLDAVEKALPPAKGRLFVVADGGQVTGEEAPADLFRPFRFLLTFDVPKSVVLAVGTARASSRTDFLQVVAWDSEARVYNYYARVDRGRPSSRGGRGRTSEGPSDEGGAAPPSWVWNGDSTMALDGRTRGRGPFDGHVNGSLVMKELKSPWNHWHSSSANIDSSVLPEGADRDLFDMRDSADQLEKLVVRPGVQRWTDERLARAFKGGTVTGDLGGPRALLRHLFESTTFNLTSTGSESRLVPSDGRLRLPLTFFLGADVIKPLIQAVGGRVPATNGKLQISYDDYVAALASLDVHLLGRTTAGTPQKIPGDTHFAFLVPEPALEDVAVVLGMLDRGIFSARFLLCTQLVDFANPMYSSVRKRLMAYADVEGGIAAEDLQAGVVDAILTGAAEGDEAARQFKTWWDLGEEQLAARAATALQDFVNNASKQCESGGEGYVQQLLLLADQRRRWAKGFNNPLDEFDLTLPVIGRPPPPDSDVVAGGAGGVLTMREDGTIGQVPTVATEEWQPFTAPQAFVAPQAFAVIGVPPALQEDEIADPRPRPMSVCAVGFRRLAEACAAAAAARDP